MTQNDISKMLRAYNDGLLAIGFEHYQFIKELARNTDELNFLYVEIESLRYELDDQGFYIDNTSMIRPLEKRVSNLEVLINDMESNFIKLHKAFK